MDYNRYCTLTPNPRIGIAALWCKLRDAEYTRGVKGLFRVLKRLDKMSETPEAKKKCA